MDRISSMGASELLMNLRKYPQYGKATDTDYYIKKAIGGKKQATVDQLRKELTKLSQQNSVITPFQVDDVKYEILSKLPYPDILKYCATNKMACDNKFWGLLIDKNYPMFFSDNEDNKSNYHKYFQFFDEWTTRIMSEFMTFKSKYINMQNVYDQINKTLIKYFLDYSEIDLDEDRDNDYIQQETLELNLIYDILDILTVSTKRIIKINQLRPPRMTFKETELDKIKHMAYLLSDMHLEFIDL